MNQAVFLHTVPAYTRCIHCMEEIASTSQPCPHCGHPEQEYYPHPLYLSPYTRLQNQYLLGEVLGQGGFGITYIGLDLKLNKRIAIKEYLPSSLALREPETGHVIPLHNQKEALQKGLNSFIQEARNLAKFNHPNIVRVLNYFEENQTAYMVMEYLEGDNPARRLCDCGGSLELDEALNIVLPILDALEAIHAQQVFHLDVSAHNILLTQNDVPVLIDFGAARSVSVIAEHTRSMTLVLKPGYSPLEQYSDQGNIGPWTDIYACAALLYLLLHGQLPPAATERWQQDNLVVRLGDKYDVRISSIERALKKALAVNMQERWQSVAEFRAALLSIHRPILRPIFAYALLASLLPVVLGGLWLIPNSELSSISAPYAVIEQAPQVPIKMLDSKEAIPTTAEILQAAQSYWLNYAQERTQAKQFEAAYQSYQSILRLQPAQADALLGLKTLAQQRLAQAQALYQQAHYQQGLVFVEHTQQYFPGQRDFQVLRQAFEQAIAEQARQTQITHLLSVAEQQLQAQKLTTPAEDNAYDSYQALLAITDNDSRVLQLPERIADSYAQLANKAERLKARRDLIQKGLNIFPQHAGLLNLQEITLNTIETTQSAPQIELASASPAIPQVIMVNPIQQQTEQIAQWLQTAQQALDQDNLEVAHEHYQKVLTLQPQHADALNGLQTIVANYARLAQQQKNRGKLAESLVLVGKGLGVQAQYPDLLRLQQELQEELDKPSLATGLGATESTEKNSTSISEKPLLLTPSF